jgi:hypothetical protein
MVEKAPIPKEKLKKNTRSAVVYSPEGKPKIKEYNPSNSEELLEQICRSFGTELEKAYVIPYNGTKLVRLSKPVALTNLDTGERNLLVMQSTRFSPFCRDQSKIIESYKNNSKKKLDDKILEEIEEKIKERDGEWDHFKEITDNKFIPNVALARWRKELYFAIFNLDKNQDVPKEMLKPFIIHEHMKGIPDIYIVFHRQPQYFKDDWVEKDKDVKDALYVDFPKIHKKQGEAMESALLIHPVNRIEGKQSGTTLFTQDSYPRGASYTLSPDVSTNLTMALIQTHLKRITLGNSL